MVKYVVIRPELFMSYDPGAGGRGDTFWIPTRSSFGFRLGYGLHIPVASE